MNCQFCPQLTRQPSRPEQVARASQKSSIDLHLRCHRRRVMVQIAPGFGAFLRRASAVGVRTRMNGAPGKIRTRDPQIRSLVLYPTELPVHAARAENLGTRLTLGKDAFVARGHLRDRSRYGSRRAHRRRRTIISPDFSIPIAARATPNTDGFRAIGRGISACQANAPPGIPHVPASFALVAWRRHR